MKFDDRWEEYFRQLDKTPDQFTQKIFDLTFYDPESPCCSETSLQRIRDFIKLRYPDIECNLPPITK